MADHPGMAVPAGGSGNIYLQVGRGGNATINNCLGALPTNANMPHRIAGGSPYQDDQWDALQELADVDRPQDNRVPRSQRRSRSVKGWVCWLSALLLCGSAKVYWDSRPGRPFNITHHGGVQKVSFEQPTTSTEAQTACWGSMGDIVCPLLPAMQVAAGTVGANGCNTEHPVLFMEPSSNLTTSPLWRGPEIELVAHHTHTTDNFNGTISNSLRTAFSHSRQLMSSCGTGHAIHAMVTEDWLLRPNSSSNSGSGGTSYMATALDAVLNTLNHGSLQHHRQAVDLNNAIVAASSLAQAYYSTRQKQQDALRKIQVMLVHNGTFQTELRRLEDAKWTVLSAAQFYGSQNWMLAVHDFFSTLGIRGGFTHEVVGFVGGERWRKRIDWPTFKEEIQKMQSSVNKDAHTRNQIEALAQEAGRVVGYVDKEVDWAQEIDRQLSTLRSEIVRIVSATGLSVSKADRDLIKSRVRCPSAKEEPEADRNAGLVELGRELLECVMEKFNDR